MLEVPRGVPGVLAAEPDLAGEGEVAAHEHPGSRTGSSVPTTWSRVGARFQRELPTVVLGPAIGGFSELFQGGVSYFKEDQNKTGTKTAVRKLARTAFNLTVAQAIGALSATMPGRLIPGALIQAGYHPVMRATFVDGMASPPAVPKGPMRKRK